MTEERTGAVAEGLDWRAVFLDAWRVFSARPVTLLGLTAAILVLWIPTHFLLFPSVLWVPLTLVVPCTAIGIRRGEATGLLDAARLGKYPEVLAILSPAAAAFILLQTFPYYLLAGASGFFGSESLLRGILLSPFQAFDLTASAPVGLVEIFLAFLLGPSALLSVHRGRSSVDCLVEVFSDRRRAIEVFQLAIVLTLVFALGLAFCCVGAIFSACFAWACLGAAYLQLFEE